MRIGIFDPYLDDLGGGEKYMMTVAECLSKNHQVDVFWDDPEDLETLTDRFSLDVSKIRLVPNIFSSKTSFPVRFFSSRKYDAIIFLSDGSIPFISCKLFVHIQQPLPQMQINSLIDKIKLRRVSLFICNSNYTKSFIDKDFSLQTTVLYPPIDLKPKEIKKENIILSVGRFRVNDIVTLRDGKLSAIGDYKKQSFMIAEFKKLVNAGLKDWKFVLAVSVKEKEKSDFEDMQKSAQGYPIEFLINKKNDELWETYSKSKIYWHASGFGEDLQKHPEFAEHFGISTVEAMGSGVVPVVINSGGQVEIVENGKNGFLWDSEEELIEKTNKLIKDEKLFVTLSENARIKAKNYSKENFVRKIKEIIE